MLAGSLRKTGRQLLSQPNPLHLRFIADVLIDQTLHGKASCSSSRGKKSEKASAKSAFPFILTY
jgi:hypothetical protein